jgi:hypothetical protein
LVWQVPIPSGVTAKGKIIIGSEYNIRTSIFLNAKPIIYLP